MPYNDLIDLDDVQFDTGEPLPLNTAPRRKVRHAPDPVQQRRGANNRKRGHKAEVELARLLTAAGFEVIAQGGSGRRDMIVRHAAGGWCVEVKARTDRWLQPREALTAWKQAAPYGEYGALLFACLRHQGRRTEWRVYELVEEGVLGFRALDDWISTLTVLLD